MWLLVADRSIYYHWMPLYHAHGAQDEKMEKKEKIHRCAEADTIPNNNYMGACVVYGRTVGGCEDCSFSTVVRPAYLRRRGIDPATEET